MACGEQSRGPTRPQVFSSLFLAGKGLLAFQGLSRGFDLLTPAHDSPQGAQRPDMACRPGRPVKSTVRRQCPDLLAFAQPADQAGMLKGSLHD